MKHASKALISVLLLAALLIGGGLLYRHLAPGLHSLPENETEASVPVAHRHEESAPAAQETPAAETAEPQPAEAASAETPAALSDALTADFCVLDEDGNTVQLSDYFGKPIVVNFWATWCPPCRAELPYFDAAAEAYDGQVQFLMIHLTDGYNDTVESATAFVREENKYSFPLFFDTEYSGVEAYQINAIPVTLFINADGSLLHQQIGSMDEAALDSYIRQLLA